MIPAAGLATALTVLLWLPLGWRHPLRRAGWLWLAAPLGVAFFLAGVWGIQIPLDADLPNALGAVISPFAQARWPVLPSAAAGMLAALVQEGARLAALGTALLISRRDRRDAPWAGALTGAAVGLAEAVWLLSAFPPTAIWGEPLLERATAVAFHIGAGVLLGEGIARRRPGLTWLAAVGLHGSVDTGAALYQMGRLSLPDALGLSAGVGGLLWVFMVWLARREPEPQN